MPFWSGEKLEEELEKQPDLIHPFDKSRIDCASYRLAIGGEVYVSPTENSRDARTIRLLNDNEAFIIPPGQFAFLQTEETVSVPTSAIAFISIRAKLKFRGLVNVSGFHVDPGYKGRLVFAVYNSGPSIIQLRRGDQRFLIWYADLDRDSRNVKKGEGFARIGSDLVSNIGVGFKTIEGLSKRIDAIGKQQAVNNWALTILSALVIAMVTRVLFPTVGTQNYTHPAPVVSSTSYIRTHPSLSSPHPNIQNSKAP